MAGYPLVKIHNSTTYKVSGKVEYLSVFCSNDDYAVPPMETWEASSRGVCLLTKITAVIHTPDGDFMATPYESSGTSYSQFAVIRQGPKHYSVTRVVTSLDNEVPEDYMEPTEQQK